MPVFSMVTGTEILTPAPPACPQFAPPPWPPVPPAPIIIPLFINFTPPGQVPLIVKAGILVEVDDIVVDAGIVISM
jgi:hypothetical protein